MLIMKKTLVLNSSDPDKYHVTITSDGCRDIIYDLENYPKIMKSQNSSDPQAVFSVINQFFATLDDESESVLYDIYLRSKNWPTLLDNDTSHASLGDVVALINHGFIDADKQIGFLNALESFCETYLVFPDLTKAGRSEHHSKDRTFYLEDFISLTAISLLCIMIMPIWSELMLRCSKQKIVFSDSAEKDLMLFDTIYPIIDRQPFKQAVYKLRLMVESSVVQRKQLYQRKSPDQTLEDVLNKNNLSSDEFTDVILGVLFSRRLATYLPETLDAVQSVPNIAVYINDGVLRTIETRFTAMKSKKDTPS